MVGVAAAAAMGPTVMVPLTATAAVAPVTFACGMVAGRVRFTVLEFAVVGVPVMLMATVPLFIRVAVPAVSPAGSPDTAK